MGFEADAVKVVANNRKLQHKFSYAKFSNPEKISSSKGLNKKINLSPVALDRAKKQEQFSTAIQITLLIEVIAVTYLVYSILFYSIKLRFAMAFKVRDGFPWELFSLINRLPFVNLNYYETNYHSSALYVGL